MEDADYSMLFFVLKNNAVFSIVSDIGPSIFFITGVTGSLDKKSRDRV